MTNLKTVIIIFTLISAISVNFSSGGRRKSRPPVQPRIYHGRSAAKGQFPYQVLLHIEDEAHEHIYACGGSIISRDHILTAAHCIVHAKTPGDITVYAGTIYYADTVERRVSQMTMHPANGGYNNDIAVLKLKASLEFSDVIDAIPLAKKDIPDGAPVIVSGWGNVNRFRAAYVLQYDTEYSISRAQCLRRLGTLGSTMRCMRRPLGHGTCSGDSGGPAVHNGELIGVNSYIINDCGLGFPDVFTDVVATRAWILKNMK
ncbi:PREDICTED: serine protease SP24D-like [Bactrocera latifrons]|uniref:serine protease SP24D-like n=1 Tax=Bactrocera latifrons TaxID=174628 RepID=UPI0008DE2B0F|nr:PREDICTED: serine protease SP24D-like [Bactrocera latifrons]